MVIRKVGHWERVCVCVVIGVGGFDFGWVTLFLVALWCELGRVCGGSRVLRLFWMALMALL